MENQQRIENNETKPIQTWISEQFLVQLAQFDQAMETHYPESKVYTQHPDKYLKRVTVDCNYLEAAKLIDFKKYLPANAQVLDMAGGIGWLSAYLSKMPEIETLYYLDSSKHYINQMLPYVLAEMKAEGSKIQPIHGLFAPLLFPDNSLDCVVVSSSLHHAENLESLLKEISRVLKNGGYLLILNETPLSYSYYLFKSLILTAKIIGNTVMQKYKAVAPAISSSGTLYDPYLGDKRFPLWYWKRAITNANFEIEEITDSKLPTVKNSKGLSLVHFICKKVK